MACKGTMISISAVISHPLGRVGSENSVRWYHALLLLKTPVLGRVAPQYGLGLVAAPGEVPWPFVVYRSFHFSVISRDAGPLV